MFELQQEALIRHFYQAHKSIQVGVDENGKIELLKSTTNA